MQVSCPLQCRTSQVSNFESSRFGLVTCFFLHVDESALQQGSAVAQKVADRVRSSFCAMANANSQITRHPSARPQLQATIDARMQSISCEGFGPVTFPVSYCILGTH
ncbi:hypothetical protein TWF569_006086 [Orbilia oligospora]|nr:hypothetical protein TWF569_006086 [Orbilia oligospora]